MNKERIIMNFEGTLIQGITVARNYAIFEKYATDDRIYALWSQFLTEHNKLMQGKANNAYSCIRGTLILLSLADKEINVCDAVNDVNYETRMDGVEFLKLYAKSLINIKEKHLKGHAFNDICLIACKTLLNVVNEGEDMLWGFTFDIFEDFKAVLLAEEGSYYKTLKEEILNAMLYCDSCREVYNYDTSTIFEIMEDVVDDSTTDFEKYDDYLASELHMEAHRFLEDYLAECTIPFKHDELTENNCDVLVARLANLIEENSFAWLVERADLEDGYYKVNKIKAYKGYVGTILYRGVYYDFDTDSNDIVARQENVKGEFAVSSGVMNLISGYYETKYYN